MQEAAKQMIAQGGGGSIVNLSSVGGKQGFKMFGGYCASKFGVVGLTQTGGKRVGQHQIRVNAICPGIVHTPMWDLIDRTLFERGDTQRIGQALQSWVDGSRPDSIISRTALSRGRFGRRGCIPCFGRLSVHDRAVAGGGRGHGLLINCGYAVRR